MGSYPGRPQPGRCQPLDEDKKPHGARLPRPFFKITPLRLGAAPFGSGRLPTPYSTFDAHLLFWMHGASPPSHSHLAVSPSSVSFFCWRLLLSIFAFWFIYSISLFCVLLRLFEYPIAFVLSFSLLFLATDTNGA